MSRNKFKRSFCEPTVSNGTLKLCIIFDCSKYKQTAILLEHFNYCSPFYFLLVKRNFHFQNTLLHVLSATKSCSENSLLDSFSILCCPSCPRACELTVNSKNSASLSHRKYNNYHWSSVLVGVHFASIQGFEFNPGSESYETLVSLDLCQSLKHSHYHNTCKTLQDMLTVD